MSDVARDPALEMRGQFDPSDPFDAMAESFRTQVLEIALGALKTTIFREMPPHKQIECFLGGMLPGIISICFSYAPRGDHDYILEYIAQCLPTARQIVDETEAASTQSSQAGAS